MKNQEKSDLEKLILETKEKIQKDELEISKKLEEIKCFSKVIEFWCNVKRKIFEGKKVVLLLGESKAGKTLLGNYLKGEKPEKYVLEEVHAKYYIPSGKGINEGVGEGLESTTDSMSIIAETEHYIYIDAPGLFDYKNDGDKEENADTRLENIILYWHSLLPLQDKISAILLVIDGIKATNLEETFNFLQMHGNALKGFVDYSRIIPVITKISNQNMFNYVKDLDESIMRKYFLYFENQDMLQAFNKDKLCHSIEPPQMEKENFKALGHVLRSAGENKDAPNPYEFLEDINYNLGSKIKDDRLLAYVKPAYEIGQVIAAKKFKESLEKKELLDEWVDIFPTEGGEFEKKVLDACKELKLCEQKEEVEKPPNIFKDIATKISFEDIVRLKSKLLLFQDSVLAECVNPVRKFLLSEERKKMFFHPSSKTFANEL